jgi:Ni,Fe-hydrogenase III large subunit
MENAIQVRGIIPEATFASGTVEEIIGRHFFAHRMAAFRTLSKQVNLEAACVIPFARSSGTRSRQERATEEYQQQLYAPTKY